MTCIPIDMENNNMQPDSSDSILLVQKDFAKFGVVDGIKFNIKFKGIIIKWVQPQTIFFFVKKEAHIK